MRSIKKYKFSCRNIYTRCSPQIKAWGHKIRQERKSDHFFTFSFTFSLFHWVQYALQQMSKSRIIWAENEGSSLFHFLVQWIFNNRSKCFIFRWILSKFFCRKHWALLIFRIFSEFISNYCSAYLKLFPSIQVKFWAQTSS